MASVGGLGQAYAASSAVGSVYGQTQKASNPNAPDNKTDNSSTSQAAAAGALASAIVQSLSQLGVNTQVLTAPTASNAGNGNGTGANGGSSGSSANAAQQALNQFLQGLVASLHNGVAPPNAASSTQSGQGEGGSPNTPTGTSQNNPPTSPIGAPLNGADTTNPSGLLAQITQDLANAPNVLNSSGPNGLTAQIGQDLAQAASAANILGNSGAPGPTPGAPVVSNGPVVYTPNGTSGGSGAQARLQNLAQHLNAQLQAAVANGSLGGASAAGSIRTQASPSGATATTTTLPPPAASTGATLTSSTGSSVSASSALPQAANISGNNPASPTAANLQQSFQRLMQSLGAPNQTSLDGFLSSLSSHLQHSGSSGLGLSATA